MSDEDALRQSVLAAPADDLPRLVYADAVEDAGDAVRAEFIRAQVRLDRTSPWEPEAVRARHHSPEWIDGKPWRWALPELGKGLMADWAETPFRRGFGWHITVKQLAGFMAMAPEIFAREPVGELSLPAAGRDDWQQFAESEWLANIERLRFTTGSGLSEPVRALAHSPFAKAIDTVRFEVSTSPGMAAVVEMLLQSPLAGQLKHLEFRLGHDRDGDVLQELNATRDLKLESLTLTTMGQGADALTHLAGLPHAEGLKSFAIVKQPAGGVVAEALSNAMGRFPLQQFMLLAGQITGTDLRTSTRNLLDRTLRQIDVSENVLEDVDALLRYRNLRSLSVRHCGLDTAAITAIAQSPFWPNLVELDLRGNVIDTIAADALTSVPPPSELVAILVDCEPDIATRLRDHFGEAVL